MTRLDDKTALITGGGRGIALQLAQRGPHVAEQRALGRTLEAACVRPGR
jgi:NAD(P)-dependent dehydrogenase (short-subunit alcohol dehydrogenase family)